MPKEYCSGYLFIVLLRYTNINSQIQLSEINMSCLKGKSKVKKKDAKVKCKKCGAFAAKKGDVCKVKKVKS